MRVETDNVEFAKCEDCDLDATFIDLADGVLNYYCEVHGREHGMRRGYPEPQSNV